LISSFFTQIFCVISSLLFTSPAFLGVLRFWCWFCLYSHRISPLPRSLPAVAGVSVVNFGFGLNSRPFAFDLSAVADSRPNGFDLRASRGNPRQILVVAPLRCGRKGFGWLWAPLGRVFCGEI
jgi:hypothetical protein